MKKSAGAVTWDPVKGRLANVSHPAYAMIAFLILTALPYLAPMEYMDILKLATLGQHLRFCALLAGLIIGMLVLYDILGRPTFEPERRPLSAEFSANMYWLAKALMLVAIAANGVVLLYALPRLAAGGVFAAKMALQDFEGVNILTQTYLFALGPYIYLSQRRGEPFLRILLILGGLLAARAFLMAERLALMELAVPAIVVLSMLRLMRVTVGRMLLIAFGVPTIFVVAEVFRSFYAKFVEEIGWAHLSFSFVLQWNLERLALYYTDVLNKFYLILQTHYFGTTQFYLEGVHRMAARLGWSGDTKIEELADWVALFGAGNVEMTNPGGLASLFTDFGWWAVPVLFGFAFLLMLNHWRANRGGLLALAMYPTLFMTAVELPRFVYLYSSRVLFPMMVFLAAYAGARLLSSRTRHGPAPGPETEPHPAE
jgi:oligosaccharide repeat unit polymerase